MKKRSLFTAGAFLLPAVLIAQGGASFHSDSLPAVNTSFWQYTIVCRTNKQGTALTELVCDTAYAFPCGSGEIGCVTFDSVGGPRFTALSMAAAAEKYGENTFLPTKAPAWILGSPDYYAWRNENFLLRCKLCGRTVAAPDYYLDYGNKYATRFPVEVRPKLSPQGQDWLDKTFLLLQIATEDVLEKKGDAELDGRAFRRQLFGLHAEVYEVSGFFELPFHDKWIVLKALDLRDVISDEGREQIAMIGKAYAKYLVVKRTGIRRSESP
jgi:hypothetical protein